MGKVRVAVVGVGNCASSRVARDMTEAFIAGGAPTNGHRTAKDDALELRR